MSAILRAVFAMVELRRTILLVEDDNDDQRLVRRALEKNNVANEVLVVGTGNAALEAVERGEHAGAPFDLVILDLRLPDIDGLEVLRAIRRHERLTLTPVVVLTGTATDGDIVVAYRDGANSVVIKPIEPTEFSEMLLNVTMYWLLVNCAPTSAAPGPTC